MSKFLENCPKFYYINLDKSPERKNRMESQFKENNVLFERIDAIDGNNLKNSNRRLSNSELGCTLSHLKAIEKFYESGDNLGIICEDDLSFEFLPYWKTPIQSLIQQAPKDWNIIMLGYIISPENIKYLEMFNGYYQPFNQSIHSSTLCYLINRNGAWNILKNHTLKNPNLDSFYKNRPVSDIFIFESSKTYCYKFCLFTFPDDNTSLIHPDHISFHMKTKEAAKKLLINN
jgi:GR25 family glycosyltransferase involved in LPS biosynthesis